MAAAIRELGAKVQFFTLIPEFRPEPHYQLWAEPGTNHYKPGDTRTDAVAGKLLSSGLEVALDKHLGLLNIEYRAKRESLRLGPIELRIICPGSYERFRKESCASGISDAQIKVAHLNPKEQTRKFFSYCLLQT